MDVQKRKATLDGVDIKSKMEDRDEISEEDEVALWKNGLLGCHSAISRYLEQFISITANCLACVQKNIGI